uniref:Lipocalin n=1 Tax=Rhipicephalus zambeziensis TaxID=60191 RepID=A0A224YE40_9ACAR
MNILSLLALHSFVCTVIGGGSGGGAPTAESGRNSGPRSIFDTPLGRSQPVYLVGFSAELNRSDEKRFMRCVFSDYNYKYGKWVERRLVSQYKDDNLGDREPVPLPINVNITILDGSPGVLTLNVTVKLNVSTGAKSLYEIEYSDDESIVLAERGSSLNEESRLCSLWVTGNYTEKEKIPSDANKTFYAKCKEPVYVGFSDDCWKLLEKS